ncbi:hypothetical protein [Rhizobium sp. RCAM05973]|uniref:hypothetical protein n=1 Tax=Rhizobium sp. RCAM05973 TaxID=2994066 RepID=UPI0022EBC67B|nr:hypothetical protein [Rhizobium sp. RCAM05973]
MTKNLKDIAAMITVGNILDHKAMGNLHGWCERVRKALREIEENPTPASREVALSTSQSDPAPKTSLGGSERLPYDLRLRIGNALDCLVCDDSSPEQVDKFIETFREFGLTISAVKGSTE